MSPNPPPPPFVPGVSPIAERRWQKQAHRAQKRAAALAAKQQRAVLAAQARLTRRKSVLGPLLLVTLGGVFLLAELDLLPWDTAFAWFGRWWPLVLVGSGLALFAEWSLDSWMADGNKAPLPRRTLGGGAIRLASAFLECTNGEWVGARPAFRAKY